MLIDYKESFFNCRKKESFFEWNELMLNSRPNCGTKYFTERDEHRSSSFRINSSLYALWWTECKFRVRVTGFRVWLYSFSIVVFAGQMLQLHSTITDLRLPLEPILGKDLLIMFYTARWTLRSSDEILVSFFFYFSNQQFLINPLEDWIHVQISTWLI